MTNRLAATKGAVASSELAPAFWPLLCGSRTQWTDRLGMDPSGLRRILRRMSHSA
jgi:hypothetical protein